MSKVFIIEPPRNNIDVSDARKFGDIVYVFNHEDRRCSAWEHIRFGRTILRQLESLGFNPDADYVCIAGSMLTISIAIITVAQRYDEFNVLLFNSVNDCYVEKHFNRNDWKGDPCHGTKNGTVVKNGQRIR